MLGVSSDFPWWGGPQRVMPLCVITALELPASLESSWREGSDPSLPCGLPSVTLPLSVTTPDGTASVYAQSGCSGRWHSCPCETYNNVSVHIHINYSPKQLAQSHLTRDKEFDDKSYASSTRFCNYSNTYLGQVYTYLETVFPCLGFCGPLIILLFTLICFYASISMCICS